jgi:Fis family transcriptional regulator
VKNQLSVLIAQMHESGILYSEAVREFKKVFISHVLQQNNGNQCKAAKQLGMHRNTLSRTIAELDLDVGELRANRVNGEAKRPPRSAPAPLEKKAVR